MNALKRNIKDDNLYSSSLLFMMIEKEENNKDDIVFFACEHDKPDAVKSRQSKKIN